MNLHNGAIVIHNHTDDTIEVYLDPSFLKGAVVQEGRIAPGGTFISDRCCFAAGTSYRMRTLRSARAPQGGRLTDFSFTPHLCNRDGIPYGYAVLVVYRNNTIHEIDHEACYEGPR